MARVPFTPVPEVATPGPAPGPRFNAEANPAEFGGLIGQGEQRLGADLGQAGNELFGAAVAKQQFLNQVNGDNAYNQFQGSVTKMMYGDPSTGQVGFYGMKGQDAVNAFPGVMQKIDQLRENIKGQLPSGAAALAFDDASRRLQTWTTADAGRHYDQQTMEYAGAVNQATLANSSQAVGLDPLNDATFNTQVELAKRSAVRNAQLVYGTNADPAIYTQAASKAVNDLSRARVLAMAQKDPAGAMTWLQAHSTNFDPKSYEGLNAELKGTADRAGVASVVNGVIAGPAPPVPASLNNAIVGKEGSGPNEVSDKGAAGIYQITPGLFMQFSQPGENFGVEADREVVAQRALAHFWQQYQDPQRVAVAWFSGSGNVAPPGNPTPWLVDKSDGHTTTSQYVAGVNKRLGPEAFDAEAGVLNNIKKQAEAQFPNRPDLQNEAIRQGYEKIQITNALEAKRDAAAQKQLKDNQDATMNGVVNQLIKDPSHFDPSVITGDPNLTPEQREWLWSTAQRHMNTGGAGTNGPQFVDLFTRVTAPPGTPGRITDSRDLWPFLASGNLAPNGYNELNRVLQGRNSPQGEAENTMLHQFLKVAHNEIAGKAELLNLHDPKGEELYQQFLTQFLPAYQQAKANGTDPSLLLSTQGKDSMLPMAQRFARPQAEWLKDMTSSNDPNALLNIPKGEPLPAAAGYSFEQLQAEMMRRGLLKPPPAPPRNTGPQVPTNE